jgi:hypothetical protein
LITSVGPLDLEHDLLRHAVQREVAGDLRLARAAAAIDFDLNVIVGNFATSKKSGDFRCPSRFLVRGVDAATSIEAFDLRPCRASWDRRSPCP